MTLQVNAAKVLANLMRVREDYGVFVKRVFETLDPGTTFHPSWHIDLMAEYLEALQVGDISKLIINIPPRELKSIAVTVAFPAWMLGHDPSSKILCASYASGLSTGHSLDCRRVIESDWYQQIFPNTRIAKDQNEKTKYKTTEEGHRISTSVGASVIGMGGDCLILDDPIDYAGAHSPASLKAVNTWIDTTWSTRKNNPSSAIEILIMQRLHIKDPTAHLLDTNDGEQWTLLKIQRRAMVPVDIVFPRSGRVVHRAKGDLLNPERNGPREVASMEARLGDYGFESQQQQEPSPAGGGRIKLEWFPALPPPKAEDVVETVISFDTAQKDSELNDPSVGIVFKREVRSISPRETIEQWHIVDVWSERVKYPDLKVKVIGMSIEWNVNAVIIEDKSSGSSLIQELETEPEFKVPVIGVIPRESKIMRLDSQTPHLRAGVIALPDDKSIEWLAYLRLQLKHFPAPASWDELDALSQFLWWLNNSDRHCTWGSTMGSVKALTKMSSWTSQLSTKRFGPKRE